MTQYSQAFIDKLREVYPDDDELHQLAADADPKLWGIIHDRTRPFFELCGMVTKEAPVKNAVDVKSRFA